MNLLGIAAPPLIGAAIGYITNYIAIKMLFRPVKPIYFGRFRLPFTPGIVPKRKDVLADILGREIVKQFFNADDLELVFTSEAFKGAVANSIVTLINDPDTKLKALDKEAQKTHAVIRKTKEELCIRIQASLLTSDIGGIIASESARIIQKRLGGSVLGRALSEEAISALLGPLKEHLQKYILEDSYTVIMPMIEEELHTLSQEPIVNIAAEIIPDINEQRELIGNVYARFMATHVRSIVESIDICGMITEKVKQMNPQDIEKLVLSVVRHELHYVVILGALIGFIIGAVNIFI